MHWESFSIGISRGYNTVHGNLCRPTPMSPDLDARQPKQPQTLHLLDSSKQLFSRFENQHAGLWQWKDLHITSKLSGEGNGTPLQYSCLENPMDRGAWKAAVHGVAKSRTRLSDFTFTFHFHALEEEMATHSSILAWRIPGTAGPGGMPSMGSHRVGHDWSDLAAAAAAS